MDDVTNAEGYRRLVLGMALFAAVAVLWLTLVNDPDLMRSHGRDPGPTFQPLNVLRLLGIAAVFLIFDGLRRILRCGWQLGNAAALSNVTVPALMIATLIGFVVTAEIIGFLATSLVFSLFWSVVLAVQDAQSGQTRPVVLAGAASLFVAVGIHLVFERIIGVPLP